MGLFGPLFMVTGLLRQGYRAIPISVETLESNEYTTGNSCAIARRGMSFAAHRVPRSVTWFGLPRAGKVTRKVARWRQARQRARCG